jgi:bifunctional non-homologous end joining protein LigD
VKFQQCQEFVIGGFTEDGDRIDALVVGYYEGRRLLAAGKVRAGLTPLSRRELRARLLPLLARAARSQTCPTRARRTGGKASPPRTWTRWSG